VNYSQQSKVNFSCVTFIYTNKCNAQCSHCCLNCGPDKNDKFSPELVKDILISMQNRDISQFFISGGEPFLFLEEIEEILSFAHSRGLKPIIGSNGFWGVSYEKSYNILSKLYLSGLRLLLLSTDQYHQAFVGVDKIVNIVKAAEDIGIKVKITVNMTRKEIENASLIELFKDSDCVISFKEPKLIGRAVNNISNEDLSSFKPEEENTSPKLAYKSIHTACNQLNNPVVTPDKRVWICCGIPSDRYYYTNFNLKPYVLGNIGEKSLEEILKENENNSILKILMNEGPIGLVKIIEKVSGETYKFRDKYYWTCDLCCEILGNKRYVDLLENEVENVYLS
jgi:MoaA/NifB/PqqE/SkfB family radical SAM enzyme